MNNLIKVFLYIVIGVSFLFLIFYTFLTPQYEKIESLSVNNTFNKHSNLDNKIFIENFSKIDSIYYSNTGSYTKRVNKNITTIELGTGKFLFDINDLTKKYTFSYKGFNLEPLGTGIFYLDTTDKTKINLISKENIIKILFKDINNGKIINKAFLYPHEYIVININRNNAIKDNADFIRVKGQVFTSGYISDRITKENTKDSNIGKMLGDKSIIFLNNSIKNIKKKNIENTKEYNEIQKLHSWTFPGINYLEKHIYYFYNPSKKIVYYKNNIINYTLKLFGDKNLKTYITRSNIKENLEKLKYIDNKEYIKMIDFINYIYNVTLYNNSLNSSGINSNNKIITINDININRKINFYNLKLEINKQQRTLLYPSIIYIKSAFNLYDNGNIDDLNKNINNFLLLFYKDLRIKVNNGNLIYNSKYATNIDYLGFYIKNYISHIFSLNTEVKNNIDLINKYIILNENIYFKKSKKTRIQTGIYEGISFLNRLKEFIRNRLFKKDRSDKGLLIVSDKNNLSLDYIKTLNGNIKKLSDTINKNKSLIENIELFKQININLKEYFSALLNYELYIINYDKIQKEILNIKTLGNKKNTIELSRGNFVKYITYFDGIDNNSTQNANINIIDKNYYSIDNIYINGKSFSFDLYPYEGNRLEKIFIKGLAKDEQVYYNNTYILNKQKNKLLEKASNADGKEKDKYDFKKIFLNKFFEKKNIVNNNNDIKKNINLNEDKIVILFKSNKLLGENGEFNLIKNIVNIKYSEVIVKRIGNNYNININGSLISLKLDKYKSGHGLLYGKYILDNNSHYFNNIKIQYYSRYEKIKKLGAAGNQVNLIGKVNLLDLKKELKKFFLNTNNIELVYNSIYNTYIDIQDLKINYDIISGKIIFKFKNNNNLIEISFKSSNIINIIYNGTIVKGKDNLNNLLNILLTIKN